VRPSGSLPTSPDVFAVEDTSAQVVWHRLAPGEHRVEAGDASVVIEGDGHPAAVTLEGLPPGSSVDLVVDGQRAGTIATLRPPPGAELCRLATVSDLHIGEGRTFGILPTVHDHRTEGESPVVRATKAAGRELVGWGAELLVAKGDITHHGRAPEWLYAADLLRDVGIPVVATTGNHDGRTRGIEAKVLLGDLGIELAWHGIAVRDLPGIRVIVVDTRLGWQNGTFRYSGDAAVEAAAASTSPVLVALHHDLPRLPFPTHWPPGVFGPESGRFLRALAEANPNALVTSGHSHRNRRHKRHGLVLTEVGSPKDHPGVWGGYVVHEGGIRQVVRRIEDADVLRWTEATGDALFGVWGRYAPGRRRNRCFTHQWR
jgi:predicted phosphodiesterase